MSGVSKVYWTASSVAASVATFERLANGFPTRARCRFERWGGVDVHAALGQDVEDRVRLVDGEPVGRVAEEIGALETLVRPRGDAHVEGQAALVLRRTRHEVRDETGVGDVGAIAVRRAVTDGVGDHARVRRRCWRYASPTASAMRVIVVSNSPSSTLRVCRSPFAFVSAKRYASAVEIIS